VLLKEGRRYQIGNSDRRKIIENAKNGMQKPNCKACCREQAQHAQKVT
jgi:hypothetical protein